MRYVALKRAGLASAMIAFTRLTSLCLSPACNANCEYRALSGAEPSQIKAGGLVSFGCYPQSSLRTDAPLRGTENTG